MQELTESEVKALELLAIKSEPVEGQFDGVFQQLVRRGLAQNTGYQYEITDAGCDYLSIHAPGGSVPKSDTPCGFVRL